MKQIGKLINTTKEKKTGCDLSLEKSKKRSVSLVNSYYGSAKEFMIVNNPDRQKLLVRDKLMAFKSEAPSLTHVRNAYSDKIVSSWLLIQLESVNNFCSVKQKMNDKQLREAAISIESEFSYLNVDELMLFFQLLKTGAYGEFYGAVDPMKIMVSLREFTDYRRDMISRVEAEDRNVQLFKPNPNVVSREAMEKLKREAKNDISAFIKLFRGANIEGKEKELWEIWRKNEREGMQLIMG